MSQPDTESLFQTSIISTELLLSGNTEILPSLGQVNGFGSSPVPANMPQTCLESSDYCHLFAFLLRPMTGMSASDNSGKCFPPGKQKNENGNFRPIMWEHL